MSSLVWTLYVGQTGKILRAQLRDADGAVDLDAFDSAPKLQVALSPSSALLVNLAATPDDDQTTETFGVDGRSASGKGWLEVTTEATMAALAKRSEGYLLFFKALNAGDPVYFPTSRSLAQTYGRLIVQDPLGP